MNRNIACSRVLNEVLCICHQLLVGGIVVSDVIFERVVIDGGNVPCHHRHIGRGIHDEVGTTCLLSMKFLDYGLYFVLISFRVVATLFLFANNESGTAVRQQPEVRRTQRNRRTFNRKGNWTSEGLHLICLQNSIFTQETFIVGVEASAITVKNISGSRNLRAHSHSL